MITSKPEKSDQFCFNCSGQLT